MRIPCVNIIKVGKHVHLENGDPYMCRAWERAIILDEYAEGAEDEEGHRWEKGNYLHQLDQGLVAQGLRHPVFQIADLAWVLVRELTTVHYFSIILIG